jgi:hypothetical protein
MTAARELIAALMAAGMDAADAAALFARAVAEVSTPQKSAGAIRQQRYRERHKASQTVTPLRSDETSQTVTNRNESVTSNTSSLSLTSSEQDPKKERKREGRASQLPDGWRPEPEAWAAAVDQLGGEQRAEQELSKFRNHALDKGRTSKRWGAAWANWVDRALVYAGGNHGNGTGQARTYQTPGPAQTRDSAVIAGMGRALERRRAARAADGTGPVDVPGRAGPAGGTDADGGTAERDGKPHRQLALLPFSNARNER